MAIGEGSKILDWVSLLWAVLWQGPGADTARTGGRRVSRTGPGAGAATIR